MSQESDAMLWLEHFSSALDTAEYPDDPWKDPEWTDFMGKVVDQVAAKMGCYAAMLRKRAAADEYSGEYLNIDALFFDLDAYDVFDDENWDPFVLPRVAVELENSYDPMKISYCLWKLLCIRTRLRVLVCYQEKQSSVQALRRRLEDVVKMGHLAEGDCGGLLILIGDDSVGESGSWGDYYSVFEWVGASLTPLSLR